MRLLGLEYFTLLLQMMDRSVTENLNEKCRYLSCLLIDQIQERKVDVEETARGGVCDKEVCGHLKGFSFAKTFVPSLAELNQEDCQEVNVRRRPIVMFTEAS